MSLASRVANLFSGSSISHERDHSKFEFSDNVLSDERIAFADIESRRRAAKTNTMPQEEPEEGEGRPPYLHV